MRDLAVIVPSRGRPGAVAELADAWDATGAVADLVIVVDSDDPELESYGAAVNAAVARGLPVESRIVPPAGMNGALNSTAHDLGPWTFALGFLGDDHRPRTWGWDRELLRELRRLRIGFVYGNDLLQGALMPTAIAMTSSVVSALGYFAPPALGHLNLDVVWKEWGEELGRISYRDDVVIEHMHPAAGKAELDEGYLRVNAPEEVAHSGTAYADYHSSGAFDADVAKLRGLL